MFRVDISCYTFLDKGTVFGLSCKDVILVRLCFQVLVPNLVPGLDQRVALPRDSYLQVSPSSVVK